MSRVLSEDEVVDKQMVVGSSGDKLHPWRICPTGYHFVKTHLLKIPPSKDHPEGQVVTRHAHCAKNPTTHKDLLSLDEIKAVSQTHFSKITELPKPYKKFVHGDDFDREIAGWVSYWSEVFKPKTHLDPNLIKALIASESSFKKNQITPTGRKKLGSARGLMQITDSTRKIFSDHKGELRNHYILLSETDALDPSANICAGIRWLFRKKVTAKHRLHHEANWQEAIAEYKGILANLIENNNPESKRKMQIILDHYKAILSGDQK